MGRLEYDHIKRLITLTSDNTKRLWLYFQMFPRYIWWYFDKLIFLDLWTTKCFVFLVICQWRKGIKRCKKLKQDVFTSEVMSKISLSLIIESLFSYKIVIDSQPYWTIRSMKALPVSNETKKQFWELYGKITHLNFIALEFVFAKFW